MCTDCGINNCNCQPVVVQKGNTGNTGSNGNQGIKGNQGYAMVTGFVQNDGTKEGVGNLYAQKFIAWVGGEGTPPDSPANPYMQPDGTFGVLSTAINFKGQTGKTFNWLGTLSSAPREPNVLDAYRDSTLKEARFWNGTSWQTIVIDGLSGDAGDNGISVTNATIDGSGHLILTLSDSSTIDAGVAKGSNGNNGTNGTNGVNGFLYETVDGNLTPAQATDRYQLLMRNSSNTGYEFVSIVQLKEIINSI